MMDRSHNAAGPGVCRYREESPTHGAFSSFLLHTPTHCIFQCILEEVVSVADVIDSDSAESLLLACPFCSFPPPAFKYPTHSVFRSQEAGAPTPSLLQLGNLCVPGFQENITPSCVYDLIIIIESITFITSHLQSHRKRFRESMCLCFHSQRCRRLFDDRSNISTGSSSASSTLLRFSVIAILSSS